MYSITSSFHSLHFCLLILSSLVMSFSATNPPAGAAAFATTPAAHLNFGVVNPAASMIQSIDPRLNQPTVT